MTPPVRIPIDPDHSVGTEAFPYRTTHKAERRHMAILAGVAARVRDEGMGVRDALVQVKRRLNAIRVVSKRQHACGVYERDLQWITTEFGLGNLNPVCTKESSRGR